MGTRRKAVLQLATSCGVGDAWNGNKDILFVVIFDMLKKKKSMFHTLFIGKQKPTGGFLLFSEIEVPISTIEGLLL